MKIVTWNLNSIRARLERFTEWLAENSPDVLLLQETKCEEHAFPKEAIEDLGYNVVIHGQKTFNGVAILSKYPIEDLQCGLPTYTEDPQARYIEAVTNGVRVASVYIPNGQDVGTEKYAYKLSFLERLRQHLAHTLQYEEAFVIGGDYNIAPTDLDVADPKAWHEEILCSTAERKAFNALLNLGYRDAFRIDHPAEKIYSWWDYRSQAWPKNEGLRIDHLLLSPQATDRLEITGIDRTPRGKEKASDHAPVWCLIG
ncbi:exodeoxyribonuclease III [Candidatus Paracaedibacter symbiosus]|uniref:exodeoxyribonuclease III n=1 Tax=Candidatus Paracaedibacter symbiosus TaxID=244582 RepID=UPI0005098069|nr:exodeoxyribonuclease III [Candidatus Paracaedibacter symbiosus]